MKVIVLFSGGKDSQAALIHACHEFGSNNVEAVFCDTGWEHEFTYKHVLKVAAHLKVNLVTLTSNIGGFENLCLRMKWFPDSQRRICTVQLKIQPFIDYILKHETDLLIIQGIRSSESIQRSKLKCSGLYFEQYFDNKYKGKSLYRKKDVLKWALKYKAYVDRPMFAKSAQDIIDYIIENGQEPNPLYKFGCARVGCFPCIYSRLSEIKIVTKFPKYVKRVIELEDSVNFLRSLNLKNYTPAHFFQQGKIPARYCKKYGDNKPSFEDIIKYVQRDDAQLDLFSEEESLSCMSIYHGLCE